jgi:hypothetical protein
MKSSTVLRLLVSLHVLKIIIVMIFPSGSGKMMIFLPELTDLWESAMVILGVVKIASLAGMFIMKRWGYWALGFVSVLASACGLIGTMTPTRHSMILDNYGNMLIGLILGVAWAFFAKRAQSITSLKCLACLFSLVCLYELLSPFLHSDHSGHVIFIYPALKIPVVVVWFALIVVNLASLVGIFMLKKWAYWPFCIAQVIGTATSLIALTPPTRYSLVKDNYTNMLIGLIVGVAWFTLGEKDGQPDLRSDEISSPLKNQGSEIVH